LTDKLVEIQITDLAFDGKAVGHIDGKVVFLNGGLPGEIVLAEIVKSKPRYDKAIVREILTKSDRRTPAPCSHFGECGGCTWQDLDYDSQLFFKKKQVTDCLQHIGGMDDVLVSDVMGSVELFNYRNKMEFSFNTAPDGGFTVGLHRRGQYDQVFDLDSCHLQVPVADRIVHWVRRFVAAEGIPVYDVKRHTGYMRFLMIRVGKRTGQLMVNLVTNYGDFPNRERLVRQMMVTFPEITTIVHNQNGQKSNIATGEIENVMVGAGYIEEKLFDRRFRIRANSFFQTNPIQTEALYRSGFDMLQPDTTDRVLDLYCGAGSISILLAEFVEEVVGVELVPDAIRAARDNAELNQIENVSFFQGDVKDFLKERGATREDFPVAVVDPPRAGLHPKALKRVLELSPRKLLYISCNPSTFARDAKALLDNGYRLPRVQPVDMFPQTMHIELVGLFQKD